MDLIIAVDDLTNIVADLTFTRTFLPFCTALSAFFLAPKSEIGFGFATQLVDLTVVVNALIVHKPLCCSYIYQ